MERAKTFCKYKTKKKIGSAFPSVLLEMLRFGQFYLVASWIFPYKNSGMDYLKSQSL
jgi:hypothetical protein